MMPTPQLQPPSPPRKVCVGGVALSIGPKAGFLDCYNGLLRDGRGGMIFAPDVSLLRRAQRDRRLMAAFETAVFAVNDGAPVAAMASTLSGVPTPRYRGVDFMRDALAAARPEVRHFFLGGTEAVLQALTTKLGRIGGLTVAGWHAPPFAAFEQMDLATIEQLLRAAQAQVVWVFLGNPKQELFCAAMARRLPSVLFCAVGAALEFLAVEGREAPRAWQNAGFEWAWRVAQEPRRLWRRYAATVPAGLLLLAQTGAIATGRALRGGRQRYLINGLPA